MLISGPKRNEALLGGIVIGLAGGAAGSYMAEGAFFSAIFTIAGVLIGGFLGVVVAAFGGKKFLLSIIAGACLGAALAVFLGGLEEAILGAATGGTIGGFSGVMAGAIRK